MTGRLSLRGRDNSLFDNVREIMKPLILSNADTFFIAHNHPSGNIEPSENDILFTKRLKQAGELIGI